MDFVCTDYWFTFGYDVKPGKTQVLFQLLGDDGLKVLYYFTSKGWLSYTKVFSLIMFLEPSF